MAKLYVFTAVKVLRSLVVKGAGVLLLSFSSTGRGYGPWDTSCFKRCWAEGWNDKDIKLLTHFCVDILSFYAELLQLLHCSPPELSHIYFNGG